MSSLLEAAAAVGISAIVVAMMVASLASAARLEAACARLGDELFETRQLEHLVDRAALIAGGGPGHPSALSSLTGDTAAFACDQNGDGSVDATSSETTALEVRKVGAAARVRVRLGRQTMTVIEADQANATLTAVDRFGRPASAASATVVDLSIAPSNAGQDPALRRRLLFLLASRSFP